MKPKIVIIGAGGHGKVVCDVLMAQNKYELVGFVDASVEVGTVVTGNFKVIASQNNIASLKGELAYFIVAIGNNKIREQIFSETKNILEPAIIIHPSAVVSPNAIIAQGSVVLANAVINSHCSIGENVIVNSSVVIDHECKIGNHIHLSIGTLVGSNSELEDNCLTAIGAHILPFSKIKKD